MFTPFVQLKWSTPFLQVEQNNLEGFQDFRTENGSSQGQNLAVTVFFVPNSTGESPSNGLSCFLFAG